MFVCEHLICESDVSQYLAIPHPFTHPALLSPCFLSYLLLFFLIPADSHFPSALRGLPPPTPPPTHTLLLPLSLLWIHSQTRFISLVFLFFSCISHSLHHSLSSHRFSLSLPHSLSCSLPLFLPLVGCLQAARALQLQRADSCDALLETATEAAAAAAAARGEEDGTGMELTQLLDRIRAQCNQSRLPGPGERHLGLGAVSNPLPGLAGPSRSGAAAAATRTHGGALSQVRSASCIFTRIFFSPMTLSCCPGPLPARHTLRTNSRLSHRQGRLMNLLGWS